tara:strand:- start:78 stop:485 length:408 start_codon:yes stop_codon:yes gene_type:complete
LYDGAMTEQSVVDIINKKFNTSFKLVSDKYNSYDAEEDRYILEIKNRRSYYSTKIIEIYKMVANYRKSQLIDKIFLYAVSDDKGIYVFNINKNIDEIIKLKVTKKQQPVNTDFGSDKKIIKLTYELQESMATIII